MRVLDTIAASRIILLVRGGRRGWEWEGVGLRMRGGGMRSSGQAGSGCWL